MAIEILESKNPRAAWLAFDYEGMKGVRQVNSEMEEIFKKKQEAATIVPKGDTDAGKAGVPDVTPPTIPTAAAAGKPVVAAKVDVIEPVADVQSQPIEPAPLDLEPDKVDASQTPDIPEAQAITPKPELPPKPIPPVQKEIDVEAGLEKVKEGSALIRESKKRLKALENEFEDVKKEIAKEV